MTSSGQVDRTEASGAAPSRRAPRRRLLIAVVAVAIPMLVLVLWWFEPQALLFDVVVDEGLPVGAAAVPLEGEAERETAIPDADPGPAASEPVPTGPIELASGSFESRNRYVVTGTASFYLLPDGQRLLRLEDFAATNGPDLFVLLTAAGTSDDDSALDADSIDLGALSGNIGDQNYVIPADIDLERYDTVVIWCRRFSSSFGVASLVP